MTVFGNQVHRHVSASQGVAQPLNGFNRGIFRNDIPVSFSKRQEVVLTMLGGGYDSTVMKR
jgi:hypothetical protein